MNQTADQAIQAAKEPPIKALPQLRDIMGFQVLAATRKEAVAVMDDYLDGQKPALITFLNAHVSNLASRNAQLADILNSSLILNDGVGVSIASMLLHGSSFPENLNGTDLVPLFLHDSRHRFRIYAVGAAEDIAARAIAALREMAPQHTYVGAHHGYLTDEESAAVVADIADKRADLILVAMGSPRQEIWAEKYLMQNGRRSAICVGGLFDFISKEKPRAPEWVRALRSEWIFRLMVEPRRLWQRYLVGNAIFMVRLAEAYIRLLRAGRDRTAKPSTSEPPPEDKSESLLPQG